MDTHRMASVPALLHNPNTPQRAKDWVIGRQQLAGEPTGDSFKTRSVAEAALYSHNPLVVALIEADELLDWGGRDSDYAYRLVVYCEGHVASLNLPGHYSPTAGLGHQGYPYAFGLGWITPLPDEKIEVTIHLKRPYEDPKFTFYFPTQLAPEKRPD